MLLDHSLDVLEFISRGGRVQSVSSAIQALAGYAPADVIGRKYSQFLHPDDATLAHDTFRKVLAAGHAGPVQLRYRHQNGTYRTVQVTARNCLNDPRFEGILVLTRDITEQVSIEDALLRANRELHRLSQELLVAQDSERRHLARELHDDVQQALAGLRYGMAAAVSPGSPAVPAAMVRTWDAGVAEVMDKLRRLTLHLLPAALDRFGLAVAIEDYIAHERALTPVILTVDIADAVGRIPRGSELAAFRIVQEAVANALKHGEPRTVRIGIVRRHEALAISVADDGAGFDVPAAMERAARTSRIGLHSIFERATGVGGHATIESSPGHGTTIRADIPTTEAIESTDARGETKPDWPAAGRADHP